MEARDGKVICLVRATDHPAAQDRLRMSYATDPALARHFADLAENHLEIVVGDVADPRLGLDAKDFDSLAGRVDHIVHCGALVNHMLSYADLFGDRKSVVIGTGVSARVGSGGGGINKE